MKCGKRKATKQTDPLWQLSVKDMRDLIRENLKIAELSKQKRSQLCKLITDNKLMHNNMLSNHSNSCYIDSFLTVLFMLKNRFINSVLLRSPVIKACSEVVEKAEEVREILKSIKQKIQTPSTSSFTCRSLRSKFAEYDDLYRKCYPSRKIEEIDWKYQQYEPLDIIMLFNRMFEIPNTIGFKDRLEPFSHPTVYAGEEETIDLKRLLSEYRSGNYFYVSVTRGYQTETSTRELKSSAHVLAPLSVKLSDQNQRIKLRAILIHVGKQIQFGHYVALIRLRHRWVLYDDMSHGYQTLNMTTKELLKSSYMKNGVGFIYST